MMQESIINTDVSAETVVRNGYIATKIADDLSWGVGSIQRPSDSTKDDEKSLVAVVLDCIQLVSESELGFSTCTDGRLPLRLKSGEQIPVREQMVGADIVSAFFMAECLGPKFYNDPLAPAAVRIADVAQFLYDNGLLPSSHMGCGAAGGFETIVKNINKFNRKTKFQSRLQELLPTGVFDKVLFEELLYASQMRVDMGRYSGLNAEIFLNAAENSSGKRAIAELNDDGRGVHGHVEEAIMRIRIPGQAINETLVAAITGGREVFGVNDLRMEKLARLFARGSEQDYKIAAMALEAFASSGHATLATRLNTYIVTPE